MPYKKGKSARVARALKAKEPKLVEGAKQLLVLRGPKTSERGVGALKDLALLKKPDVKLLQRKNDIRPFDDVTSLEFLTEKNDSAAFLYASHNKKRPHNLVLGRMFDGHVYDMIELGVTDYVSLLDVRGPKKSLGSHPCVVFAGEAWDRSPDHMLLKNMFLDIFGARDVAGVALPSIDHVIQLTASPTGAVFFRAYTLSFKRADGKVPRLELSLMGPSMDWEIRRVQRPSSDLAKFALKVPAQLKVKKVKNVTHDELGETVGRIHMERQDFDKLTLRKTKATKGAKRSAAEMSKGSDDEGGEGEDADADGDDDEGMGAAAAAPVARGGAGTGGAAARGPKAKRARLAAADDDE